MTPEERINALREAELRLAAAERERYRDEPPFGFSAGFERRMDRILRRAAQGKPPVVSKTVKILLIAAIVAALLAAAVGASKIYDYRFKWYPDHVVYEQPKANPDAEMTPITIKYVPRGYELSGQEDTVVSSVRNYKKGEDWLDYEKHLAVGLHGADNEHTKIYEIEYNGVRYTIFRTEPEGIYIGMYSIFWADRDYRYSIYTSENMDDDELLRIAEGVQ